MSGVNGGLSKAPFSTSNLIFNFKYSFFAKYDGSFYCSGGYLDLAFSLQCNIYYSAELYTILYSIWAASPWRYIIWKSGTFFATLKANCGQVFIKKISNPYISELALGLAPQKYKGWYLYGAFGAYGIPSINSTNSTDSISSISFIMASNLIFLGC